jgi:hypothetical protein
MLLNIKNVFTSNEDEARKKTKRKGQSYPCAELTEHHAMKTCGGMKI